MLSCYRKPRIFFTVYEGAADVKCWTGQELEAAYNLLTAAVKDGSHESRSNTVQYCEKYDIRSNIVTTGDLGIRGNVATCTSQWSHEKRNNLKLVALAASQASSLRTVGQEK